MADITMPKMGFDMEEGTLVRWLKKVGDSVKKGEPIAEIETDKVTIEIESFSAGTITKLVAEEGETIPVGATIAVLDGEAGDAAPAQGDGAAQAAPAAQATQQASGATAATAERPSGDAAQSQQVGEGGDAASGAAQQTESASQGDTARASSGTTGTTATAERPREGYGTDVTAEEEITGQEIEPAQGPSSNGGQAGRVAASPVAKRIARENNVDIATIKGSGPSGRIVREDVEAALQSGATRQAPAPQPEAPKPAPQQPEAPKPATQAQPAGDRTRREPLSRMRQTIARRLVQSKGPVPHFYVTTAIDMTDAMALREQLNAGGDVKITVNELFVKATATAMTKFPALNASWGEDALEFHDYINVGIAVATDNGLLAPALTDVDRKSLGTISREAKELIGRTREGKATLDELQRGTYSISNLGMYPVESFVAIINPPQSTNIAVGAITDTPVVKDGQVVVRKIMKATISCDHRVSDGAVAAEYMQELKRILEQPMLILL